MKKIGSIARVTSVEVDGDFDHRVYPLAVITAAAGSYNDQMTVTFKWTVANAPRVGDNIRVTIEMEDQ